jgi:hypothetical protein
MQNVIINACNPLCAPRPERKSTGMKLNVECATGTSGNEEPVAFFLGERRIAVSEIVDRWLATDYGYFKILADDGAIYILRRDDPSGDWELTLFQARGE